MLLTLLPLAGWAQFSVHNYVPKGNFIYEITEAADATTPGKVVLYGIRNGYNPVDATTKALNLEGKITIAIVDGPSFDFVVDYANEEALRKTYNWTSYTAAPTEVGAFAGMVTAESVVIPKEFLTIKENTFYGYTNMRSISFQAESQVETIESGAFNTTQINTFDFSNCSKLTTINNGLFVQAAPAINSYVTTITLPSDPDALLTNIGTAFQRLPNLNAINNLDNSKMTIVKEDAFKGDVSLQNLALPGTVETIEANAFRGSGIENLIIDVTSLDDNTAGNVYTDDATTGDLSTLKTLTLKGVLSGEFKPQAFKGCDALTTITMTDMTINGGTIGANAFENCVELTSLSFNAITEGTIGSEAFKGCIRLASVTFGNITGTDIKDALIDDSAFENCKKLGTIQFGNLEHVTIDVNAFKLTAAPTATSTTLLFGTLTDVDINASAFAGFTKMTSMTFGDADGLNIASLAFSGASSGLASGAATLTFNNLKDVVIAGTATTNGAFYNTTKLSQIKFAAAENQTIENLDIQAFAFENTASATTVANPSLTFGASTNLQIGASAFAGATKLTAITFGDAETLAIASKAFAGSATNANATLTFNNLKDVVIAGTATTNGAFYNTTKLSQIKFAAAENQTIENLDIQTYAFENTASALSSANGTLTFGNAKNITIGVSAFTGADDLQTITFGDIEDDATASVEIAASAFENTTGLQFLTFGNLTDVTIKGDAFKAATSTLGTTSFASATFGNLENTVIEEKAFDGATKLQSVTLGNISGTSVIGDDEAVFGEALKTVTIGNIEGAAKVIMPAAFTYGNVSGASLTVGSLKVLSGANPLIDAEAFDLSAIDGTVASYVAPVVTIGELKTTNTMAAGALVGEEIAKITFSGNIVANGLNNMIILDSNGAADDLTLSELVFNGEIAAAGIAANAFAGLTEEMNIKFNGKLAAGAVAAGAFEGLVADSQIEYTYDAADIDLTVNPFDKGAFKATAALADARIIKFAVSNTALKAKYQDATTGLLTDGAFGIYLAYFFVPPVTDLSFLVYPDINTNEGKHTPSPRLAWARWELGHRVAPGVTGSLESGNNLVIKRVQDIDGTHKAKITIYGTYTDEDDALNASTIYMMPLKVTNGYYYIPGTNKTTLIVKVENNGADFTENTYKVKVNQTGYPGWDAAKNSIWTGLENKELYVANNIMTNQQLIDQLAVDAASADASGVYGYFHVENSIDIYRGTYGTANQAIKEDLYIMSNPANNRGFRIDKNEISSTNNAYINTGWYYMLLKKYTGDATAARVVWMDDATEGEITGILNVKHDTKNAVKSEAIYTLQGVRVSEMHKGQIYIVNGKKFLAK